MTKKLTKQPIPVFLVSLFKVFYQPTNSYKAPVALDQLLALDLWDQSSIANEIAARMVKRYAKGVTFTHIELCAEARMPFSPASSSEVRRRISETKKRQRGVNV